MKREGVTPGIPDVNIDMARGEFNGMRIEFKSKSGKLSEEQKEAHKQLTNANFLVEVHHDASEAFDSLVLYLLSDHSYIQKD